MKDLKISANTVNNPFSKEKYYKGSDKDIVLLFHGFTGVPGHMYYLGERIYKQTNYSVYIPRLPGHGTNSSDFRQSNSRDWLRKAYDSYLNISHFNNIYIAGLSMGGLLALLTAAKFEIDKLITISAALYALSPAVPFTHIVKYIIPKIKVSNEPSEDLETEAEKNHWENYWQYHYTAQVAELHKLMMLTRRKLKNINCDSLIIASTEDNTVPIKASYKIKEKINSSSKELVIFNNSPHVINNGPEKKECADKIIDFLS
ncbi:MAG: alpha/beta hydrolase [Halothermotrichaceae bacterium]